MIGIYTKAILMTVSLNLCACSAAIIAAGKNEEEFVQPESTIVILEKTLGTPETIVELSPPVPIESLSKEGANLLKISSSKSELSPENQLQESYAIEKAFFKYKGNVQLKHDVGDAIGANLMTLGIGELFLIPAAVNERVTDSEFLFIVWFDLNGKAIAYRAERIRND
jgi:hypothetical protein